MSDSVVRGGEATSRDAAPEAAGGPDALRSVLDNLIDGVVSSDERGTVRTVNAAVERIFGYAPAELIGRNVKVLMPEPYHSEHDGYIENYLTTGLAKVIGIGREVEGRRKDGSTFPVDLAVSTFTEGGRPMFTAILRDITERKRSEARIREQAELLDKVRNAVMVRDADDRIVYWNRGAEQLYGWTAAEAVGRVAAELFRPGPAEALAEAEARMLTVGEWDGELRNTAKDGRTVFVQSHWSALHDDAGAPRGKIVINIDVTEKRELEARFLRAQRLESIGTLVSGIAHDLNNVLTPVLMTVKLLKRDRPGLDKAALLDVVRQSVERGATILKQLLAFGGGLEGERVPVHLKQVVKEVCDILDHTLPKSVTIRTQLADGVWPVTGDITQLTQVLMNLCVNARDAMPDGGTVTIGLDNKRLNERIARLYPDGKPGPYAVLTVADTGTGIPPEVQQRMFDPFFTTKPFGQGTGLGLSTVVGIVRSHGGFVNVYSELGRGTKVAVFLPAAPEAAAVAAAAEPAGEPAAGAGQLVLAVDDESAILAATKATLEAYGYRVVTANGGREGIEAYGRNKDSIAVVLLDMMMPGTDGPAVLRELRAMNPAVRVIATSGLRPMERVVESVADGTVAFLPKPFSDDELLRAIADQLTAD